MLDKGYDYPLFSLNLMQGPGLPDDDPRYYIPDPRGRLVVSAALRQKGAAITTYDCLGGLYRGLAHHARSVDGFTTIGLDAGWAQNLQHWGDRLEQLDVDWRSLGHVRDVELDVRRGLRLSAQDLWSRLRFAGTLAGLGEALARGRLPRREQDLIVTLRRTHERVDEPALAGLLDRCGFPAAARAALQQVAAELEAEQESDVALGRRLAEAMAAMVVMRGAIIGDLRLLSGAVRRNRGKYEGAGLRMQALLGRPRRRRGVARPVA